MSLLLKKIVSNATRDSVFNNILFDSLSDTRNLKDHYKQKVLQISVENASYVFKIFQYCVNADVFFDIFRNLRPDINISR